MYVVLRLCADLFERNKSVRRIAVSLSYLARLRGTRAHSPVVMWTRRCSCRVAGCAGVRGAESTVHLARAPHGVAGCFTTVHCLGCLRFLHDPRTTSHALLVGPSRSPTTASLRSFSFFPRLSDVEQLVEATKMYSPGQTLRPAPPPAAGDARPFGSLNRSHRPRYYVNPNSTQPSQGTHNSTDAHANTSAGWKEDVDVRGASCTPSRDTHELTHAKDEHANNNNSETTAGHTASTIVSATPLQHEDTTQNHSACDSTLSSSLCSNKGDCASGNGSSSSSSSSTSRMPAARLLRNNNNHSMCAYTTHTSALQSRTKANSPPSSTPAADKEHAAPTRCSAHPAGEAAAIKPHQHVYQERCVMGWSLHEFYRVVADVECYEEFLPWCAASRVHSRQRTERSDGIVRDFASATHPAPSELSRCGVAEAPCEAAGTSCGTACDTARRVVRAVCHDTTMRRAIEGEGKPQCDDVHHRSVRQTPAELDESLQSSAPSTRTTCNGASADEEEKAGAEKANMGALAALNDNDPVGDDERLELLMATLTVGLSYFTESYTSKVLLVPGRRIVAVLHQRDGAKQPSDAGTQPCGSRPQVGIFSSLLYRAAHTATTMALRSSILQNLRCEWRFREVPGCPDAVEVMFDVSFQFVNPMYGKLIMSNIVSIMTRSFERRCERLYGPPSTARRGLPLQHTCDGAV